MSKQSGLGMLFLVAGVDMSGDTQAIDGMGCPRGTFDVNGLDTSAMERIYGRRDGNMALTSYFNKAAGKAHSVWKTLPTADVDLMAAFGTTLGKGAAAMRSKQVGYDGTRAESGEFTFKVETQSNGSAGVLGHGLEYGRMATAGKRTDTTATNGASIDLGSVGSLSFGLRAWLQVTAFTGTNITIKLQGSSDDGAGDAFADITGGAFTVVTAAPAYERIETTDSLTVERYLRVVTTGTFTSCTFAVMVHRNEATPV